MPNLSQPNEGTRPSETPCTNNTFSLQVIYEDLCSFKSKSSSLLLQQQLNFQPKEKRDWVIKELIETEGSYVDVLNMLRKHFIRPISTMKVQQ